MNQIKIISDIRIIVVGVAVYGADAVATVVCLILRQVKHDLRAYGIRIPYSYYCVNHSLASLVLVSRCGASHSMFRPYNKIHTEHRTPSTNTHHQLTFNQNVFGVWRVVAVCTQNIESACVGSATALSWQQNNAGATNDCTTINDMLNTKWRITCDKSCMYLEWAREGQRGREREGRMAEILGNICSPYALPLSTDDATLRHHLMSETKVNQMG